MIKRMDHINIVVSDLEQAMAFFLDMGFEETHSAPLSGEKFTRVTGLADFKASYVALALPGTETNLGVDPVFFPRERQKYRCGEGQSNRSSSYRLCGR